jgi:hypothetical protein
LQTTNRIGHIDDAFLSRMSVALTYDTLDNTKQKLIWRGFLTKLRKERKEISLTGRAETYLENLHLNEDTKGIPWNGREIRNGKPSKLNHFRQVKLIMKLYKSPLPLQPMTQQRKRRRVAKKSQKSELKETTSRR